MAQIKKTTMKHKTEMTVSEYLEQSKKRTTKPKHEKLKQSLIDYLRSKGYNVMTEVSISKLLFTTRKYKIDIVTFMPHPGYPVHCIEINGGQWTNGRHNRAGKVKGKEYTTYENDLNKLNMLSAAGYKVLQFTYEMLQRKEYEQFI